MGIKIPGMGNKDLPTKNVVDSKKAETADEENVFIPQEPRYSLDDIIFSKATKAANFGRGNLRRKFGESF